METPKRGTPGQKDLGFREYVRKIFKLISNEVIIALNKWYGLEYREHFFSGCLRSILGIGNTIIQQVRCQESDEGNRKIENTFPGSSSNTAAF